MACKRSDFDLMQNAMNIAYPQTCRVRNKSSVMTISHTQPTTPTTLYSPSFSQPRMSIVPSTISSSITLPAPKLSSSLASSMKSNNSVDLQQNLTVSASAENISQSHPERMLTRRLSDLQPTQHPEFPQRTMFDQQDNRHFISDTLHSAGRVAISKHKSVESCGNNVDEAVCDSEAEPSWTLGESKPGILSSALQTSTPSIELQVVQAEDNSCHNCTAFDTDVDINAEHSPVSPEGLSHRLLRQGILDCLEDHIQCSRADKYREPYNDVVQDIPDEDWSWMSVHHQQIPIEYEPMPTPEDSRIAHKETLAGRCNPRESQAASANFILESKVRENSREQQRYHSTSSQKSSVMDISPETSLLPPFGNSDLGRLHIKQDGTALLDSTGGISYHAVQCSSYALSDDSKVDGKQSSGCKSSDLIEANYRKDHRRFYVRSVHHFESAVQVGINGEVLGPSQSWPMQCHEHSNEAIAPPEYRQSSSEGGFSTPKHITPTQFSPLRRLSTPLPLSSTIHQSVEKDLTPRRWNRESTPAYEDRSLTPSPVSCADGLERGMASDVEMVDAPIEQNLWNIRCQSMPMLSQRLELMLPPPSPNKSGTTSPQLKSYDSASPSMLRSPAIARLLEQSQSSQHQTQYPSTNYRNLSPVNHSHGSSFHRSIMESINRAEISASTDSKAPAIPLSTIAQDPNPRTLLPPPIPSQAFPIKLAKRSAQKPAAISDKTAKVGKARSVTNSVVAAGSNDRAAGKRKATVGRQRAVTQRLVKALDDEEDKLTGSVALDGQRVRRSARPKEKK